MTSSVKPVNVYKDMYIPLYDQSTVDHMTESTEEDKIGFSFKYV